MNLVCSLSGLLLLALPALAADVHGHALVTKRLTKKALSPIVYNLRGTAAPPAPREVEPVNEFDRMVVILEGGGPIPPKPPVTETLNQQGSRFEPDLIVVPTGSTVAVSEFGPHLPQCFLTFQGTAFRLGLLSPRPKPDREIQ